MAQTATKGKSEPKPKVDEKPKAAAAKPEPSPIGGDAGETKTVTLEIDTVEMTVPLAPIVDGEYAQRHIDLQLEGERAETLKRITDGLIVYGATLANGRKVTSQADAIRWWLDGTREANQAADSEPSGN